MNVFNGNFGAKINAIYVEQNRKTPLGTTAGEEQDVTIIVDESYTSNWQSETVSQNWDILVYGEAGSVLENSTCVGGTLKIGDRNLRIETYALSTNQRTRKTAHVELGCSQL